MKEKVNIFRLLQEVSKDTDFQKAWRLAADAEDAFNALRDNLSVEQAETLDAYLAARERLGMLMAEKAYQLGAKAGGEK